MTPTEQDKKLESKLEDLAYWMYESSGRSKYILAGRLPLHPDEAVKILMQLITADRKRVALEARLEERQMLSFHRVYGRDYQATLETLEETNDERIAELKAQQEEV